MSEKPTRPWFRFHLLTAVLMMVSAGGVLWLEAIPPHSQPFDKSGSFPFQGWPWTARYEYIALDNEEAATTADYPPMFIWIWTNVAKDAGVCLLILAAVALVSEYLIRRREGRKP